MKNIVRSLKTNAMQWLALGVLLLAMGAASKKAVIGLIVPVIRVGWPFLLLWIGYRFIRGRVEGAVRKFQEQMMAQAGQSMRGTGAAGGQVLDLCPKCGVLESHGHRC